MHPARVLSRRLPRPGQSTYGVTVERCRAWFALKRGSAVTSYKTIKTDIMNAGARWEDSEVVTDDGVITSRNPGDLEAFSKKIIEEVKEGRHQRRAA